MGTAIASSRVAMMKKKAPTDPTRVKPRSAPATSPTPDDTILLRDLAPRQDISGGAGKLFFGERVADKGSKPREK